MPLNAPPDEYGNPAAPAAPPQPRGGSDEQVRAAFLKYMGHANTSNIWQDDPNWEEHISQSDEAKNYAAAHAAPAPGAPPAPPAAPANTQGTIDSFWQDWTGGTSERRPRSKADLDAIVAKYPDIKRLSDDKVQLPNGQIVDALGDYNPATGMGSTEWSISGGKPGENGQGGVGGGGGGGSVPGTINGSTSTTTTTTQNDPYGQAVQDAILKQLQGLQNPTDPNSATVRAIVDPYHLSQQRGLEQTRRALAEQAYASGNLNTGGYGQSQIGAVEKAGENEANFTGQTVATQESQRQAMLMNILGLGQNASQFSQQLSATQKNFADNLAQQDKQFQQTLAQNIAQFGSTLGYQYALLDWSKKQTAINGVGGK